jgi:hypothetical protein
MADRRYDDKEVGEILKAAAEMQSGLIDSSAPGGMTLTELQRVAGELGIDPEHIGRAARELGTSPKPSSRYKSDSLLIERTVDGELSDETWDELVTELRRFAGKPGKSEKAGNSREWTGKAGAGSVMLSATTRRGRTRLKLLADSNEATGTAIALSLPACILLPILTIAFTLKYHAQFHPLLIPFLAFTMLATCIAITSATIRSNRKKLAVDMHALLSTVATIAEAPTTPQQLTSTIQTEDSAPAALRITSP